MEFCIKLYVITPWLFVQFWNFSALQHYLCHQPLFYSQESWALFQFPTNVSISLHMGLALQVIFAKVFVRKSYWNSIAQLGRNSRLKNTPRIIQKYAEKKLSDINKKIFLLSGHKPKNLIWIPELLCSSLSLCGGESGVDPFSVALPSFWKMSWL